MNILNIDCNLFLPTQPDKFYDIGIVDPPYGLNFGKFNRTNKDKDGKRYKANKYENGDWDSEVPEPEYFEQLFRVCKDVIIWGGNYFPLPPHRCFVFWYKQNPVPNFSDGEYAFTTFDRPALCADFRYYGSLQGRGSSEEKIHPTQKPVELYSWLLEKFATPGMKILDTHLGSGSIAIACNTFGVDLTATEINPVYYAAALKRISLKTQQQTLF